MVKGINKQIIEIKCTNSELFEKALLFVSPLAAGASERQLEREAASLVSRLTGELDSRTRSARSRRIFRKLMSALGCICLVGAAAGLLIYVL